MPQDVSFIEQRRYRPEPMSELEASCIGAVTHEDYSVYTQRLASACEEGKEMLVRLGISEPLQSGDVCHAYYTARGDLAASSYQDMTRLTRVIVNRLKFLQHTVFHSLCLIQKHH